MRTEQAVSIARVKYSRGLREASVFIPPSPPALFTAVGMNNTAREKAWV